MKIDTETIDAMALSLREVTVHAKPDAVEVTSQMVDLLEMEARATILGGVAVDPCIAVGLEIPNQVRPSQVFSDAEAAFLGTFVGVELIDFTAAIERSPDLAVGLLPGQELITHGFIFSTDGSHLEDLHMGNLGAAYLMPLVAVLPGSLYNITRLTL